MKNSLHLCLLTGSRSAKAISARGGAIIPVLGISLAVVIWRHLVGMTTAWDAHFWQWLDWFMEFDVKDSIVFNKLHLL